MKCCMSSEKGFTDKKSPPVRGALLWCCSKANTLENCTAQTLCGTSNSLKKRGKEHHTFLKHPEGKLSSNLKSSPAMSACNGSAWGFLLPGYPRSWSPVYHEKIPTETPAMNWSVHATRVHSRVVQSRQNNRTTCLPSGSAWPGPSFSVNEVRLCHHQRSPQEISKRHLFWFNLIITAWSTATR